MKYIVADMVELLSLISEDYYCVRYVPCYSFVCICHGTEDYYCVSDCVLHLGFTRGI